MTIKEALKEGSIALESMKEARILLSYHLGVDALRLILQEQEPCQDVEGYFKLIQRAKEKEPIEYITQTVSFYSREFHIQKGALIPRPETELLVDQVLQKARKFKAPKIAEIGVGSGIISIMIALQLKDVHITATDISQEALDIAQINAKKFGVEDKITFLLQPYLPDVHAPYDIIVSNPPYIAQDAPLEKNLDYEPNIALFGGEVGDEVLKNIIDLATYQKEVILCCEMGYDQKASLSKYIEKKGYHDISFYRDLSDFDRGFHAHYRSTS